eukprot:g44541.t1
MIEDGAIDVAYMDFTKAFDKAPHGRLVQKIKLHGIHRKDMEALTRMQERFITMLPGLECISYKERLDKLGLFLLVCRRLFASATFEVVEESQFKYVQVRWIAHAELPVVSREVARFTGIGDGLGGKLFGELPVFEMFYAHVKRLQQDERQLTQLEKCALMESLVLLSNQFKDYERQKAFLEELMAPVTNLWLSEEMQ